MASSYFFFCKSLMPSVAITSAEPSGFLFEKNQPLTVEQPKVKERNTRGRSSLATRGAKVLLFISHQAFQLVCRSLGGSCRPRGFSIWLPLVIERWYQEDMGAAAYRAFFRAFSMMERETAPVIWSTTC